MKAISYLIIFVFLIAVLSMNANAYDILLNYEYDKGDTYVYAGAPSSNFGTEETISIITNSNSNKFRGFIIFDISNFTEPNIIVNDAEIGWYNYLSEEDMTFKIFHVYSSALGGGSWSETAITWNNQPCGAGIDQTAECNTTIINELFSTGTGYKYFNVTELLQREINAGGKNISIMITSPEDAAHTNLYQAFYTKEWGTASQRPKFTINYDVLDLIPPVISNLINSTTTNESVIITWDTDESSNYTATIGACPSYTDVTTVDDNIFNLSHIQEFVSLLNGTEYCFNVSVYDISGNNDHSTLSFFTALNPHIPDVPVISNLINSTTTNESVIITWDTDIESNYTATMGMCPSYTDLYSYADATQLFTFSVSQDSLNQNVNYCFNVTAYGIPDLAFSSADLSFTTGNYTPPPYLYSCVSNFSITDHLVEWFRFELDFNGSIDRSTELVFWEAYPVVFGTSKGSADTGNFSAQLSTLETGTMSLTDTNVGHVNYGNNDKFSISFWVRPIDSYEVDLIGKWDYPIGQGWVIQKTVEGYILARFQGGWQVEGFSEMVATSTLTVDALKWTHVVVTYDGGSDADGIKIYINGVESTQTVVDENYGYTFQSAAMFQIGNVREYFGLNGRIDEVAIYDVQLCQSEVSNIYLYGASVNEELMPHVDEQFQYSRCPVDSLVQLLLFALVYLIAFATIIVGYYAKNGASGIFGSLVLFFAGIYMFPCLSAIGLLTCATALMFGFMFSSKGWFNNW